MRKFLFLLCSFCSAIAACTGCGTTRFTDSTRTATEQLLISDAVDQSVSRIDFQNLAGKKVFFDPQYLESKTDRGYVVSSLRQHLLAHGARLMEKREQADYIVEARSGGIGTDRHDLLFGIPQMQLPAVVPGYPTSIPEIPFAKRSEQKGVAKIAVFAFNCKTGRPVWQSGVVRNSSNSTDVWVLGTGPFRSGSIRETTEFAGQNLEIPFLSEGQSHEELYTTVPVTQQAVWQEPSPANEVRLVGHEEAAKEKKDGKK